MKSLRQTKRQRAALRAAIVDRKRHVKMFKMGKQWALAGIVTATLGLTALAGPQTVAAATTADATSAQVDQQATGEGTGGQTTSADPASDQTATATQSAATTTTANQAATADVQDGKKMVTTQPANTVQRRTVAATAAQPAIAPTLTLTAAAQKGEVQAGQAASFAVKLDATGIKTTLTNAKLTLQLPHETGEALADDPATLAIGGVTPTYDATAGTLTYDFGTLKAGVTANIIVNITTPKAATANGKVLTLKGAFTSDSFNQTLPATSATLTQSKVYDLTNARTGLKARAYDNYHHVNPNPGDTVTMSFGAVIPTAQPGTELVQAGSAITLTYTLPKELTYQGMNAQSAVSDAPTVVNNADGTTALTWTFTAPAAAAQVQADVAYKLAIDVLADENLTGIHNVETDAGLTYTADDGTVVTADPTAATLAITPYNPRLGHTADGSWYAPLYDYGAIDGSGTTAPDGPGTDNDPTVYGDDHPVLQQKFLISASEVSNFTQGQNLPYFAVHVAVDANETLQGLSFLKATYFRNINDSGDLSYYPYLTLAVKYQGDGADEYHVLKSDVDTSQNVTITREQLLAWGLDPNQTVVDLFLYYHLTQNPTQTLPTNVDTMATSGPRGSVGYGLSQADYSGVPADAGVPEGFTDYLYVTTQPNADFVGTLAHSAYVLYDTVENKDEGTELYWTRRLNLTDYARAETGDMTKDSLKPQHVEVAVKDTKDTQTLISKATLLDANGDAEAATVTPGTYQLKTVVRSLGDTLANVVAAPNHPFMTYLVLPKGVHYDETSNDDTSYLSSVDVVSDDYQGTGAELLKLTWNSTFLAPGGAIGAELGVNIDSAAGTNLVFNSYTDFGPDNVDYQVPTVDTPQLTASTKVADVNDLNGDGSTTETLMATGVAYNLDRTAKLQAVGTGDVTTTLGGTATVTVGTTANTDDSLTALDLLDVLPTQGDAGLTTAEARGSQFSATLTGPVTLPSGWAEATVQYTTTPNVTLATAANADWVAGDAVSDWSQVTAFRVVLNPTSGVTLPGGAQVITFTLKVPDDISAYQAMGLQTAYNTFAVTANNLATTEPQAVGVTVNVADLRLGTYTVTRTIHYVYAPTNADSAGAPAQQAAKDVVQVATYKTLTNKSTGETIYTPAGIFAEQVSPEIVGYTPDQTAVAATALGATNVKPTDAEDVTVTYTGTAQTATVKFVDAAGNQLAPDQTVTGKTGDVIAHSPLAKTIQQLVSDRYNLIQDETVGATFTATAGQTLTITFKAIPTTTYTVTPWLPGDPADPSDPGRPVPGIPAAPTPVDGAPGYPVEIPTIPGYTPDPNAKPVIPTTDGDVKVPYTANSQVATVKFVDANGQTLHADLTLAGGSDTVIDHSLITPTIQAIVGQRYNLTSDETALATAVFDHDDSQDQTFTVTFKALPAAQYTVTPWLPGTDEPVPGTTSTPGTGEPGDPVALVDVPGYTPVETPNVPDGGGEVKVPYKANPQTATVKFVAENGQTLHEDLTLNGASDSAVAHNAVTAAIKAVLAKRYNLTGDETVGAVFDHDDDVDQTFTVSFKDLANPTYTVIPWLPGTDEPVPGTTGTPAIGEPGDPVALVDVPGYTPVETPTVPDDGGEVKVPYKANTQTATVKFVDENGQALHEDLTLTGASDSAVAHSAVTTAIKAVLAKRYNLMSDATLGAVFDHDDDTDQIFTVTFKALTKPTYTVVPWLPGTDEPVPGTTGTPATGEPGNPVDLVDVPGYTPAGTPTIPDGGGEVKVPYKSNTQTAVVKFVDENGKALHEDLTLTGASDSAVAHSAVTAAIKAVLAKRYNLTSDETLGAAFDHADGANQTFTVTFKALTSPTYTVIPWLPGTDEPVPGATGTPESGEPGDPVALVDVPGYTPAATPTIPDGGGEVKVPYTANDQTARVIFVDENGKQLHAARVLTGKSDATLAHGQIAAAIQAVLDDGYNLTHDETVGATFDHDDTKAQTLVISFTKLAPEQTTTGEPTVDNGSLTDQPITGGPTAASGPSTDQTPAGNTPTSTLTPTANEVGTVDQTAANTSEATTPKQGTSANAKVLPQTGEANQQAAAATGLGLLSLLSLLGLLGISGKRRDDRD